jgi:hypothetical protein
VRKVLVLLSAAATVLVFATYATGSTLVSGHATQHQVGQSGIKGDISFVDDGTTLSIRGTATGMNPNDFYVSLLYDSHVSGGPHPCEPTQNSTLTDAQMFVGVWNVDSNGNGTLTADQTNDQTKQAYVPLQDVHTISIRAASIDFNVAACGEIAANPR